MAVVDFEHGNRDLAEREQQDIIRPGVLQRQCSDASSSMDNEVILI